MTTFPYLVRSVSSSGEASYVLGDPLVDRYLEFVRGRCRPNTLRATAFDLKTFFSVVSKPPVEVRPVDVFDFLVDSAVIARSCGSLTASRVCRLERSPGACRRCRGSIRICWREIDTAAGTALVSAGATPMAIQQRGDRWIRVTSAADERTIGELLQAITLTAEGIAFEPVDGFLEVGASTGASVPRPTPCTPRR